MIEVPATEFAKHFGRYKDIAQREPVAITSHGRTTGYFVAEHEYAEYQRLKAMSRRALHVSELSDETAVALGNARMNPAHDHLNALLKP
jgi:PHD/YefM family antitoxin component YafN of YafNO toxin-antitoxin module